MMTSASLDILARIFLGLSMTYFVATISEVVWHRHVYHASSRTRRFWARYPRYFDYFLRHHYRHTIVHHALTFRVDHITQFKDLEAKKEIDLIVAPKNDKLIHRDGYGLYSSISSGLSSLITFNITVAPIIPILYWIAGPWVLVGGVPILILSPMLTAALIVGAARTTSTTSAPRKTWFSVWPGLKAPRYSRKMRPSRL